MGKFTIERWRCDRCGKEYDKPPSINFPQNQISATQNHEWSGGTVIAWKELCQPCNEIVGQAIDTLRKVNP